MSSAPSNPTASVKPAAVVVGGTLNGLGVCRSLAEGGIPTYVLERRRLDAARWSRYATAVRAETCHGPRLLEALRSLAQRLEQPPLLIITDELALLTISEAREALGDQFRIRLPEHNIVTTLQNKALFHEFAVANGLPVPRAVVVRDPADIKRIHELNFPVVIKPADKRFVHQGVARRLAVAADRRKAERISRKLVEAVGEIIVQEQIDGPEGCLYFSLFYCGGDRVPLLFTGRKLGDERPGMGSTVFCTAASPYMAGKLEELTRRFIERTGYVGFGSVEYKVDPRSGQIAIIEPTVGRTDWQEELATLCGVNLPLAAYCSEFGLPYQPSARQDKVVWQASWVDRLRFGAPSLSADTVRIDGYWRARDPLPAIVHYPRELVVFAASIAAGFTRRTMRRTDRTLDAAGIRAPLRLAGTGIVVALCLAWPAMSHFSGGLPVAADLAAVDADHTQSVRPGEARVLPVALTPSPTPAPPKASARSGGETFEIGDKLKIVFYERVRDVEQNKWARSGVPPLGFEERSEFTGDYTIADDGALSLPLLGSIRAADLTEQQLESELAKSFKSLTGQDATVSILSVARPGVYVLGPVRSPGSYAYMPGMTVLHALALAGGLETAGNASWERVQAVQEFGKRSDAAQDLPLLMAGVAVLQAERDGGTAQPPAELLDLVGEAKANQLIARQEQRRAALQAARHAEESALANSLQSAKQLAETASQGIGMTDELIRMRTQRVEGLRSLAKAGNVNNVFVLQAEGELADAQQRRQDAMSKYADAQQRVRQIQEEQAKFLADEKSELDASISGLEQRITGSQREIIASNRVLGALSLDGREPQIRQAAAGGRKSLFEIVRRSANGPVSLPADEMTPLRPGDLVRIVANTRPAFDEDGGSGFIKTQAADPTKTQQAADPSLPAINDQAAR